MQCLWCACNGGLGAARGSKHRALVLRGTTSSTATSGTVVRVPGVERRAASPTWVNCETDADRWGIGVVGEEDFGVVDVEKARVGVTRAFEIQNKAADREHHDIVLLEVSLGSEKAKAKFRSFSVLEKGPMSIPSGQPTTIHVKLCQSYIGRCYDRLEFLFEDQRLRKRFIISKALQAVIGNIDDHNQLQPKVPYVQRQNLRAGIERQPEIDVVPGELPASTKAVPYVVQLPQAPVPKNVLQAVSGGSFEKALQRVRQECVPSVLDTRTYGRHFKQLLWIEEVQMNRDIEMYDMEGTELSQHRAYLYLKVPGLAEKRPSVLVGDIILVQPHKAARGHWFQGGVHVVHRDEVGLRFHRSFPWTHGQLYNARFKLNRYPARRQQQAIGLDFAEERVLFPVESHLLSTSTSRSLIAPRPVDLRFFNQLVEANLPQARAVTSIVGQPPGSPPFILFGPPGTGKTVTMVEAIQQVLWHNRNARILACAPSNSAADLLGLGLTALPQDQLFRFYAPSRSTQSVPDSLRRYVYTRKGTEDLGKQHDARNNARSNAVVSRDLFSCPPVAVLKRFRVIVTTCVSASFAHGVGLPKGHFTHIFVDEAAQATEPEVMVPIRTMGDEKTNVVLAGDPRQLGPIVRSKIARTLELDTSYIERLMRRAMYNSASASDDAVQQFVKLVKNFRSHEAILKFSNERFYDGELQPCGRPPVINSCLESSLLPKKHFPVIFHAVAGKDDRESVSPSFFNVDEVIQIKTYVQALRADRSLRITDAEIGVITPYHAQVLKIRRALSAVADGVKVGSVEEFQGQVRMPNFPAIPSTLIFQTSRHRNVG
ncbi:hypothetical protein HGRIS_000180 [Hohenbuehelia grisea]|uniref:RNA helicase n=1 Tax=Hohenbuehelia grisea TaxID=104357 RepID=A0ABR3JQH0_9AGAR